MFLTTVHRHKHVAIGLERLTASGLKTVKVLIPVTSEEKTTKILVASKTLDIKIGALLIVSHLLCSITQVKGLKRIF